MVHIKRIELSHFKSFGGTTSIPFLPGFTVVSGPNGSGKSNILDAILFCLGLASSKGMRAERLPDLVNHNQPQRGTIEASVTVTFDLSDSPHAFQDEEELAESEEFIPEAEVMLEWSVTRKLRVTSQGNYTSNYYINGESATLTELHEQLNKLRIYPEGYNVVLQGDVTSIISMNSRERREIIDELAGVAAFDRKISQAKETLDSVKEREDSCRIVERELVAQRDRLSQDRIKAEKYQKLRAELQQKQLWEVVLRWKLLQQKQWQLREQIENGDRHSAENSEQLQRLAQNIQQTEAQLETLNAQVKALGEEELIAIQSQLATQEAERKQLEKSRQSSLHSQQDTRQQIQQEEANIANTKTTLEQHLAELEKLENVEISHLQQQRNLAQQTLEESREKATEIASASEAWVQQQNTLTRQIETLLQHLDPQRTQQAQLQERLNNLTLQIAEQTQKKETLAPEITQKQSQLAELESKLENSTQTIQILAQKLAASEAELQLQQDTQKRLLGEQREKQRQLDKLEAQVQAEQEAQGTYATKIIQQSGLPGVCGLVAQLGRVDPRYQLALEIAAGARLGNLVVEDDGVAAAGIALLKQKKAGRITFLPLNKIQAPRFSPIVALRHAKGYIDYAVNLIESEPIYRDIFAYVFGNTVVFETLQDARSHLGQTRIVTLDGELLESSGAMTGGSVSQRSGLKFGTVDAGESAETKALKQRLQEIDQVLERCTELMNYLAITAKQQSQELTEAKSKRREWELQINQLQKEIQTSTQQLAQAEGFLERSSQELQTAQTRIAELSATIPQQEAELQTLRQALAELERSQTQSEWRDIQTQIKAQEQQLQECDRQLRHAEQRLNDLKSQQQRLQERLETSTQRLGELSGKLTRLEGQLSHTLEQLETINAQIAETQSHLKVQEAKLGDVKVQRDSTESQLRNLLRQRQELEWNLQKLLETQQTRRGELQQLEVELTNQQAELPDPVPEIPQLVNLGSGNAIAFDTLTEQLEQLQKDTKNLAKRLQAMEPVNMLALEEYDRTTQRLDELSQKLATLEGERTELLLRIENFTTLRLRAFQEAFQAVDQNFQTIFAELSQGDGHLQLDDPEDPFNGGLNLVAHPKGKPVQRLASMSGGEKSLTALSFIFALQRYRPSPFYAFDEVDMFLDGANVERLARMIKQQAQQAQFIVVSLRRPMIESSQRTIGVTQARGAYTQVLGLKLQS